MFNVNILFTSCAILIKIGPVNPEITRVTNAAFWMRRQKSAHRTEYLCNYQTNLHHIFSVGTHIYGDYKTDISFAVAQGMLLW